MKNDSPRLHHTARMVQLLEELATQPGIVPTIASAIKTMRVDRNVPRSPALYEPSIVIVAQGRKRGFLGDKLFDYDANRFLVLAVPLPFECQTFAEPDGRPMLGVKIGVDVGTITELMANLSDTTAARQSGAVPAVASAPIDAALGDAAIRLLECLRDPEDARILSRALQREVTYRVLRGAHGGGLRALAAANGKISRIRRALDHIHAHFAGPLDIEQLAKAAAMSTSAFHNHFRAVTATSPLQYAKAIRLHKARMMMVHDAVGAAEASAHVGYESASQFSREFKRLFGRSPLHEARRVRKLLELG